MTFFSKLEQLDCHCYQNHSLRDHTSFKIGGPADYFVVPKSIQALQSCVILAKEHGVPFVVLGNGSNILVPDEGYRGMVIQMSLKYAQITVEGQTLYADAGASLARVCKIAHNNQLSGLEFAWGIPGSVGGGVYMNAGAYDGEMSGVVSSVTYLDAWDNYEKKTLFAPQCEFSYRHSFFTNKNHIICGVGFGLTKSDPVKIKEKMDDLLGRRLSKQPYFTPSAGSTFKRPVGSYASLLIDQCGLKGYSVGDAQISQKHSGFVVNTGHATCSQVLQLIDQVKAIVFEKTGFVLEREVKILGE